MRNSVVYDIERGWLGTKEYDWRDSVTVAFPHIAPVTTFGDNKAIHFNETNKWKFKWIPRSPSLGESHLYRQTWW